ncbi:MAG: hypothetical protein U1E65_20115 [Myxococcota bacterium]
MKSRTPSAHRAPPPPASVEAPTPAGQSLSAAKVAGLARDKRLPVLEGLLRSGPMVRPPVRR